MTGSVVEVTGSVRDARRRAIGRCLLSYRQRVAPQRFGLPTRGRRRTPGLRREEVATLAGVGVTWYTWLEQGRVSASDQVLRSVGRVLGIDEVGIAHLSRMSRAEATVASPPADDLRPLLASWPQHPAALLDEHLAVVATNPAWQRVVGAEPIDDPVQGNLVWQLAVNLSGGGDELLPALRRRLRMAADLDPGHPTGARVEAALRADAPDRAPLWDCRGIGTFGRPQVRLDGIDRTAFLLGAPDATPGPTVLVLLPS